MMDLTPTSSLRSCAGPGGQRTSLPPLENWKIQKWPALPCDYTYPLIHSTIFTHHLLIVQALLKALGTYR